LNPFVVKHEKKCENFNFLPALYKRLSSNRTSNNDLFTRCPRNR